MSTSILNVLKKATSDARTEADKMMSLITSSVNNGKAQAISATNSMMTSIVSAISSKAPTVKTAMTTVVNGAKTAAENASTGWEGIGSNMVSGMASGVRNNVSILTSAIESVVKAAIQKAKDVAVIKSPSRVFADQVGYMLPAGIAAGVEKGTPVALDSIEKMTQAIIKTGNANAPIGTRDRAAEGVAAGVVNNFEQNNTIVNPPQTPGKMYRDLRRTGRQLINELG